MPMERALSVRISKRRAQVDTTPDPEGVVEATPAPRGRGRPRGSKNKKKKLTEPRSKTQRKPKQRQPRQPWEDDDFEEQHYGYESPSDIEDEEEDNFMPSRSDIHEDYLEEEEIDSVTAKIEPVETVEEENSEVICYPWIEMDPNDIPQLTLPDSSADIPLPTDHIMDVVELYEILRSYHRTLRLSPFLFEDFCAALSSSENSCLLSEIHITLLKMCLKNDDEEQVHYSVNDTNNAFNVITFCLESMTYAEVLRQYLESDTNVPVEVMEAVSQPNYPFVDIAERIIVLTFLSYRFLYSNEYRKAVQSGGTLINEDTCRGCNKGGELLWCTNCEASFHQICVELEEKPSSWICDLCQLNQLRGVVDSLPLDQTTAKQPLRMEPIGRDRHGRYYWFVVRRIFVQQENENELHYYSTAPQFYELVNRMDPHQLEYQLCKNFYEQLSNIMEQMSITLELTSDRREASYQEAYSKNKLLPNEVYLHRDNLHRMSGILISAYNTMKEDNGSQEEFKNEEGESYKPLDRMEAMLGLEKGRLVNNFWSGNMDGLDTTLRCEYGLYKYIYMLFPEAIVVNYKRDLESNLTSLPDPHKQFRMGDVNDDGEFRSYRNHFAVHEFGEHPTARKKQADKKKYLSTRFSLSDEGEGAFEWSVAKGRDMYGNDKLQAKYIEWTLAKLVRKIPIELMHRRWPEVADSFKKDLEKAFDYLALREMLLRLECGMRRTMFLPQWWNSLGHTRLTRTTLDYREQQSKDSQRRRKEERELAAADSEEDGLVWVKHTKLVGGISHTLYRMKDESYRINGRGELGGWLWVSKTLVRDFRELPSKTPLGITARSDQSTLTSLSAKKAYRLDVIARKLNGWRTEEEMAKGNQHICICYSPTCRLGIPSRSVCSDQPIYGYQSCYSQTCRRERRDPTVMSDFVRITNSTEGIAKAHNIHAEDKAIDGVKGEDIPWPMPNPHWFQSRRTGLKSVLIVPQVTLRRLAKTGGCVQVYINGFSQTAKSNYQIWNYPCLRPCFDLCWRWLTTNSISLHAVALQLRILWCSIRWADMEPEDDDPDRRVVVHHPDHDERRWIKSHKEFPPPGIYERYLLNVEVVPLEDEIEDEEDASWVSATERRKSTRKKRQVIRTRTRKVPHLKEEWIDGVELKLYEIKDYWSAYNAELIANSDSIAPRMINIQSKGTPILAKPIVLSSVSSPMSQSFVMRNASMRTAPLLTTDRKRKSVVSGRLRQDYVFDFDDDEDLDSVWEKLPPRAKRSRPLSLPTDGVAQSPSRRMARGMEYDGGMLRGGGRIALKPIGDGMQGAIATAPEQVGAEETITTTPQQTVSVPRVRQSGGAGLSVDEPPIIPRYDSSGGSYGAQVAPRVVQIQQPQRQVIYTQSSQRPGQINNTGAAGKLLMIRRSDGSTQFLRQVTKEGESSVTTGVTPQTTFIRTAQGGVQTMPTSSAALGDHSNLVVTGANGQPIRRVVAAVRGGRGSIVRTVQAPTTRILRVGANGQHIVQPVSSGARIVARSSIVDSPTDPFMKRMAAEKAISGTPVINNYGQGNMVQSNVPRRAVIRSNQRPETYASYYGEANNDSINVEDYATLAEQGFRPPGRPPGRLTQAFGYGQNQSVPRLISRGGATLRMGQRMVQASEPQHVTYIKSEQSQGLEPIPVAHSSDEPTDFDEDYLMDDEYCDDPDSYSP